MRPRVSRSPGRAACVASADAAKTAASSKGRFAGGREYELTFNTTAFNSTDSARPGGFGAFAKVLEDAKIANPNARFEIVSDADRRRSRDSRPAAGEAS